MPARRRRVEGLIFDIDGTLIDSNDIHATAWQEAFARFGKKIAFEDVRAQIGKGGDLLVPDLLNAREMQTFGRKLMTYRKKLFKRDYIDRIEPFAGIRESFEVLHNRDIAIVLASSAEPDEIKHYVKLLDVEDLIDGSISAKDAKLSKPSPDIFEAAALKLKAPKVKTLIVGDSPYDILAAHRAALPIVAVRCGGFEPEKLAKAEFLWDNVAEVVRRISELDDYFNE